MMSDGEFDDFGYDFDDFGVADLSPEDFGEELAGLFPEMLAPEDIFGGEFDAPADEDVEVGLACETRCRATSSGLH